MAKRAALCLHPDGLETVAEVKAAVTDAGKLPFAHQYAKEGTYAVSYAVTDDDGGSANGSMVVNVFLDGTELLKQLTVHPGETATFDFKCQAPATPGFYSCDWSLEEEGTGPFGEIGRHMYDRVDLGHPVQPARVGWSP